MDFVTGFMNTPRGFDVIWVIMDRLTKLVHFIPTKIIFSLQKLVEIYIFIIVKLQGISSSIVFDRDPRFTSKYLESLQEALGIKLRLSSAYHSQMDRQTKRTIQSLEDLLMACVLEQEGARDGFLPLIKFTYNNSYHYSIRMSQIEALYGKRCRTPLCWYEYKESDVLGPEIKHQATENMKNDTREEGVSK